MSDTTLLGRSSRKHRLLRAASVVLLRHAKRTAPSNDVIKNVNFIENSEDAFEAFTVGLPDLAGVDIPDDANGGATTTPAPAPTPPPSSHPIRDLIAELIAKIMANPQGLITFIEDIVAIFTKHGIMTPELQALAQALGIQV